jgi:hypothetical protein
MYAFHLRQFGESNAIVKNSLHSLHGLEVNAQNDFEKMKQNVTTYYEIVLQSDGKNVEK